MTEVFLINSNCPSFHYGQLNELMDGCLGEPLTFTDDAMSTVEGLCTGGTLGRAPDRSLPLPGGFFKPSTVAPASLAAGQMAALAGGSSAGTWTLYAHNSGGSLANFSCPLLTLTDLDGNAHTYASSVSLMITQAPRFGVLYAQADLLAVGALSTTGSSRRLLSPGFTSRRNLLGTVSGPVTAAPVSSTGAVLTDLRVYYRPFD